jgi:hypothetical protein
VIFFYSGLLQVAKLKCKFINREEAETNKYLFLYIKYDPTSLTEKTFRSLVERPQSVKSSIKQSNFELFHLPKC